MSRRVQAKHRGLGHSVKRTTTWPAGARAFIVEKEERLLVAHRRDLRNRDKPAGVGAELIESQDGSRITGVIGEPVVSVVIRIAIELIRRAMERVAAALGIYKNHYSRAAAIFRVVIACESLEFAHGIDAQFRVFSVIGPDVCVDYAVEKEVRSEEHTSE